MTETIKNKVTLGLLIFLLSGITLSVGAGSKSYSSPDEKRYIQSAYEMVESGDWLTPRYHNRPRFQKPAFFYWLSASCVAVSQKTWLAARMPSVLFGAGTVLITYLLGASLFGRRTGLFSASLLLMSEVFFLFSRLATPDMVTLFFISLALYLFIRLYYLDGSSKTGYSLFAVLGLAMLTKGFAGLLIPLIVIASFLIVHRKDPRRLNVNIPIGLIIFFAIALPWFIIMFKVHGASFIDHIWHVETLDRARNTFAGTGNILTQSLGNIFRYISLVFVIFLPASLLITGAGENMIRKKSLAKGDLLALAWIATVILFYSLIGAKKTHYLLAMSPAIALILGGYLSDFTQNKCRGAYFYVPAAGALAAYIIFIGGSLYLMKYLLSIATPIWCGLMVFLPVVSLYVLCRRGRSQAVRAFISTSILLLLFVFGFALPSLNEDNGLISITDKALSAYNQGDIVGIGSHFISHNRVDAYMDMNVKKVNVDLFDKAEQLTTSKAILKDFLGKRERVFCIITSEDYRDYLSEELKRRVFILSKEWYWKKPNQLELNKEALFSIVNRDTRAFRETFKNEIYLISNKP
jgi:4-amino-4-deoxy-L-arabinose transferase-like glycosyltransferase